MSHPTDEAIKHLRGTLVPNAPLGPAIEAYQILTQFLGAERNDTALQVTGLVIAVGIGLQAGMHAEDVMTMLDMLEMLLDRERHERDGGISH